MNTKTLLFVLPALCAVLIVAGVAAASFVDAVYAQEDVEESETVLLSDPGMLPDSPLYFLKRWSEGIGITLTFGEGARAERLASLAETRLAESRALVDKGRADLADETLARYESQLEEALARAESARDRGIELDDVLARVSEATLRHQAVLADVHERVPEEARQAIERALEVSMRGHETALRAVSGEMRDQVMQDVAERRAEVEERLNELRDRGVPIPSQAEIMQERTPVEPGAPEQPGPPADAAPDQIQQDIPQQPAQPQPIEQPGGDTGAGEQPDQPGPPTGAGGGPGF